jgi:hypothetical protein
MARFGLLIVMRESDPDRANPRLMQHLPLVVEA